MNEQANTSTVQQFYESYKGQDLRRTDAQPLLDLYSDNIEWHVPEMENVRVGGTRKGLESVREFFAMVADDYEVLQFEPQEFIAQDDKVVVLGRYSWRVKATGKKFSSDWAHVYTVRGGKVVRFQEYMDTAANIRAHRNA